MNKIEQYKKHVKEFNNAIAYKPVKEIIRKNLSIEEVLNI